MIKEMNWMNSLSRVTKEDHKRIEKIYTIMFNEPSRTQWSCPTCVRKTVNRIKNGFRNIQQA